jgi:hypothetical protein
MLTPAEGPTIGRRLQLTVDEIREEGDGDQWYLVARYENHATARDAAHRLRGRNEDMEVSAERGSVFARREQ